jgi:hypothetical protein
LPDSGSGSIELFKALDAEEALETLAFASMLMRRLDGAHHVNHAA